MALIQLVYASQPFGYDAAILSGILMTARRCNERDGITGALVCRRDIYLQLLEGPEMQVRQTYDRIERDDRHVDLKLLVSTPATERMFGEWDMLHDPVRSWLWTVEEIDGGALDRVTEDEVLTVFAELASRVADRD